MKLLVCTNFAQPFHTGGAERIVQQITESMTNDYGWDCHVFCKHGNAPTVHNGVRVRPFLEKAPESEFLEAIKELDPDHVFVYSDWFYRWDSILHNAEKIRAKKSIGLVGMNRMRSPIAKNKIVADLFKSKHSLFRVLAHAENYVDAETCKLWGIPVKIIHNSVDLDEFESSSSFDFKKHYGITTSKIALCVANFFPGKGQEFLLPIMRNMKERDLTWVFVFSSLFFELGNHLQRNFQDQCQKMNLPVKFLKSIPREHVIASYKSSDLHVFPSQSECGPIVLLESMAASKPWVSMNVGHVPDLKGGLCVYSSSQKNGFLTFDQDVSRNFESSINRILCDTELSNRLGKEGYMQVSQDYNWKIVREQYRDFFQNA